MESQNRNRKQPDRYGENGHDLLEHSNESEPFGDDSMEDKTYSLSQEYEKRDTSRSSAENTSRRSTENASTSIAGNASNTTESNHPNFDDEFEKIQQNSRSEELVEVMTPQVEPVCVESGQTSVQLEILKQLKILNKRTLQITTRIGVIENSMIKNGQLISVQSDENSQCSKFTEYAMRKNMPFKTPDEFKKFDKCLTANEMEEAVRGFLNKYLFSHFLLN